MGNAPSSPSTYSTSTSAADTFRMCVGSGRRALAGSDDGDDDARDGFDLLLLRRRPRRPDSTPDDADDAGSPPPDPAEAHGDANATATRQLSSHPAAPAVPRWFSTPTAPLAQVLVLEGWVYEDGEDAVDAQRIQVEIASGCCVADLRLAVADCIRVWWDPLVRVRRIRIHDPPEEFESEGGLSAVAEAAAVAAATPSRASLQAAPPLRSRINSESRPIGAPKYATVWIWPQVSPPSGAVCLSERCCLSVQVSRRQRAGSSSGSTTGTGTTGDRSGSGAGGEAGGGAAGRAAGGGGVGTEARTIDSLSDDDNDDDMFNWVEEQKVSSMASTDEHLRLSDAQVSALLRDFSANMRRMQNAQSRGDTELATRALGDLVETCQRPSLGGGGGTAGGRGRGGEDAGGEAKEAKEEAPVAGAAGSSNHGNAIDGSDGVDVGNGNTDAADDGGDEDDFTCPICLESTPDAITRCGHVFCSRCLDRMMATAAAAASASSASRSGSGSAVSTKCPMCRRKVERSDTVWVCNETQQAIRSSLMTLATDVYRFGHDAKPP